MIFVTAYDRHALRAFEVHAIDYLLKPFDDDRFAEAVTRAKRSLRNAELGELSRRLVGLLEGHAEPAAAATPLSRLVVKHEGRVAFVRVEDLDPARFFRVHRSAIVNLDRIRELQPFFKGEHLLLLQDGTRLKLSRARRENLEARLGQAL